MPPPKNKVLFTVFGKTIHKRTIERSIFINILTLMSSGLLTLFKDKDQNRIVFLKESVLRDRVINTRCLVQEVSLAQEV